MIRLRQTIQNIILTLFKAPWGRKKCFLVDGLNRHREAANTQHHPGLVEDNMEEKEMIPGGWNRQRKASNKQLDYGSVEGPTTKHSFHQTGI